MTLRYPDVIESSFLKILACFLLCLSVTANAAVPEFSAKDLDGNTHSLKDYRGKMVVVNYWATWCPPCREELPALAIFHEAHKDKDAIVLGADSEKITTEKLKEFVEEQMLDYPVFPLGPSPETPFGRLVGLPTSFIISPDGKQVDVHVGPLTPKNLDTYLQKFK
ncbi:MAG: TlpA family protein disulfide reductase [Thiothrix sp.]|nr:MAG: TlpA family protein disulfide reductase [Thiothrix sp.]